jgi:hypothetical protein
VPVLEIHLGMTRDAVDYLHNSSMNPWQSTDGQSAGPSTLAVLALAASEDASSHAAENRFEDPQHRNRDQCTVVARCCACDRWCALSTCMMLIRW